MTRPTFGVPTATPPQESEEKTTVAARRDELGAIWERTSKANEKYMNIRLKLPVSKLKQLLEEAEGEEVAVNLVGFKNKTAHEAPNRPIYRIYEEKKRD